MNMYTNTKKSKKFILIIVFILLINFVCPNRVNAADLLQEVVIAPAKIGWLAIGGVLQFTNNLFVKDTGKDVDLFSGGSSGNPLSLTTENIIKGRFLIFDANIFKQIKSSDKYIDILVGDDGDNNKDRSW